MNKFLLGCGLLVVVVGIGAAVGAYHYLWKPAKSMVTEVTKLQEIPKLNAQVQKTAAFTPPADSTLTSDGVDRFRRTQEAIVTKMGTRANELAAKYQLMTKGRQNYTPTLTELMGAYRDLAGLIVEAKRAQVEALNQNNFSLAEYDWTRRRVYEAAGVPVNLDIEKLVRDVAEGKIPVGEKAESSTPPPTVAVPEKNRALVTPHAKEFTERAVLAAFGL